MLLSLKRPAVQFGRVQIPEPNFLVQNVAYAIALECYKLIEDVFF